MGAIHNELRRSNLGAALTRALGLTRGVEGLERVGETLTPTMDLWSQPEWAYLRKVRLLAYTAGITATVGEYSGLAIVNPTGSGIIAVVDAARIQMSGQVISYLAFATEAAIAATYALIGVPGLPRDLRWGPYTTASGTVMAYQGSDAASWPNQLEGAYPGPANGMTEHRCGLPFVLTPGWGLILQGGTVNTAIRAGFNWTERRALLGELE